MTIMMTTTILMIIPSCSCVRRMSKHGSLMIWQNSSSTMLLWVSSTEHW